MADFLLPPNSSRSRPRARTMSDYNANSALNQRTPSADPSSIGIPSIPSIPTIPSLEMSYNRPLSPGGRRIHNPGRSSDSFADSTYYQRHNSYTSPRGSSDRVGGVIPISTETFINNPPPRESRQSVRPSGYDSYSGRPRRSSLIDNTRAPAISSTTALPSRTRPAVVQSSDIARPASPLGRSTRESYYVTPNPSGYSEPKKVEHRKVYSIGDSGAKLQSETDVIAAGGGRHHKRRDSADNSTYRAVDPGRGRPAYHLNGAKREKAIDQEDAYSYTDAAGMFNETEPKWRPRRNSVDRGSRERPMSLYEAMDPKRSDRSLGGPPPSTRGWDKVNEIGRSRSVRDPYNKEIPLSPSRDRYQQLDPRDQYYNRPRANSTDRRPTAVSQSGPVEILSDYEGREPRQPGRRLSASGGRGDRSVERRGFGIRDVSTDRYGPRQRSDSIDRHGPRDRSVSIDRYGPRGSDESFTKANYPPRDSTYVEPHRRDTAPDIAFHEEKRYDPDLAEREKRRVAEERERQWLHEARDKEARRQAEERDRRMLEEAREKDRPRDKEIFGRPYAEPPREREYERRDRDRERERDRSYESDSDRTRERRHHRRDSNRPKERRRESEERSSAFPVAATGLGAAALVGAKKLYDDHKDRRDERDRDSDRDRERPSDRVHDDKHDRDRDSDRERERERDRVRDREREREREEKDRDRERERERERERDREAPPRNSDSHHSDEGSSFERNRYRTEDQDRGLNFAYENAPQQPPRPQTVPAPEPPPQDRFPEYDIQKPPPPANVDRAPEPQLQPQAPPPAQPQAPPQAPLEMPAPAIDPDEEFRRRFQQIQQELGSSNRNSSEFEADRERRRRERELRQREREARNSEYGSATSGPVADPTAMAQAQQPARRSPDQAMPGAYSTASDSVVGTDDGTGQPRLSHKRSILDDPMSDIGAQIIDNSQSDKRENRVQIVDPPSMQEGSKPKGILKRPTEKFPEDPNAVREGVAPLKDATKKGVPPGARWTKIKRELVNPEALEEAKERYEERQDCVIVLRVLSRQEIQKLADKTAEIRGKHARSLYAASINNLQAASSVSPRHDNAYEATLPSPSQSPPLELARATFVTTASKPVRKDASRENAEKTTPPSNEILAPSPKRICNAAISKQKPSWANTAANALAAVLKNAVSSPFTSHHDFQTPPSPFRYNHHLTYPHPHFQHNADQARLAERRSQEEERAERHANRQRRDRNHDRYDRDEYLDDDDENEFLQSKAPKMLEAPSTAGSSGTAQPEADFTERRRDREREREADREYVSRRGEY